MKFSNDRKPSSFIYVHDVIKSSDDKMENALKKELEATKSALKLQTIRCRHLVAAFTRKLHEKELELRASKDLRNQQLSRLLRALLILESRLKKEQKLIRQQLQEKDLIIQQQEKEISRIKFESNRKWSLDADVNIEKEESDGRFSKAELSLPTGEERLDSLCKGLLNAPPLFRHDVENKMSLKKFVDVTRDCNLESKKKNENAFRDNPVLESVNQILLKDEEDLLNAAQPVSVGLSEKVIFNASEDPTEWYETNSNTVVEDQTSSAVWVVEKEEKKPETKTKKDVWPTEKVSPIKSQHLLEEKACLEMAKKNLIVVNLEEIDSHSDSHVERAPSPVKSTASYEEIAPVSKSDNKVVKNPQKPPALPPKPARLLKPYQILQQKQRESHSQQTPPSRLPGETVISNATSTTATTDANKPSQPSKKPATNTFSQPPNIRHRQPEPKSESEASKSRPKPPDPNSKPKRCQSSGQPPGSSDPVASTFGRRTKKEELVGNCGAIKIGSSVSSLITGLSRETIVTELGGESANAADDSHVSHMVRQFEVLGKLGVFGGSNHTEDEVNDIRKNFEEFKLEDSYVDGSTEGEENGRYDGDGAENKNTLNYYATLTVVTPPSSTESPPGPDLEYKMYETFLENTGLSQKSILTPSRMLSNHRSCLKPKDVKHRSRVKAAAAIEKCNANTTNGVSTVKYWTEPFL